MHYFSRFHIYALLYSVCFALSNFTRCDSVWVHLHFCKRLSNSPLCVCIYIYTYRCLYTTSLFIPLLMGVWVASMSWYLKECCCEHSGSVQFSLVTPSCPTLCGPMDRSMPGLPVRHQLLKLAQSPVH